MHCALTLHPDTPCSAVTSVNVEVARSREGVLALTYILTGRIGELRMPPIAVPARTDELWRRTCFEAFIRDPHSEAYYEFNFAPSMRWAAYRFDGYRRGVSAASNIGAPAIDARSAADRYALRALLELGAVRALPRTAPWRLGLSAVIEDAGGRLSYWAITHPPGRPDFHHPDCFALHAPAAAQ